MIQIELTQSEKELALDILHNHKTECLGTIEYYKKRLSINPKDYIKYQMPIVYSRLVLCEKFLSILEQSLMDGDNANASTVQ
jgi:hypothetical protein